MIKTLTATTLTLAATAIASAQPLPAPPTEKYVAPVEASCEGETIDLYFPAGETDLTAASQAVLSDAQDRLEGCIVGRVALRAVTADAHSDAEAEQLSKGRIAAVASALDAHDLSGLRISADMQPKYDAAVWTPMDRKVEVRLAAWAPEIG